MGYFHECQEDLDEARKFDATIENDPEAEWARRAIQEDAQGKPALEFNAPSNAKHAPAPGGEAAAADALRGRSHGA